MVSLRNVHRYVFPLLLSTSLSVSAAAATLDDRFVALSTGSGPEFEEAITSFRRSGYEGLEVYRAESARRGLSGEKYTVGLDKICAQKDCSASQLFWHTDLQAALARARRDKKPVLSFRLLGKLDEDLSCANSRFFRTLVYSNPKVSTLLRSQFVLHWSTERDVPNVKVRFGDGREVTTTITGNSIHYVLDGDGKVLDALAGLYEPTQFTTELEKIIVANLSSLSDSDRRNYHAEALRQAPRIADEDAPKEEAPAVTTTTSESWFATLRKEIRRFLENSFASQDTTMTKSIVEVPLWSGIGFGGATPNRVPFFIDRAAKAMRQNPLTWGLETARYQWPDETVRLVAQKMGKPSTDRSVQEALNVLRLRIGVDTKINETLYRRALHELLSQRSFGFAELDSIVYNQLFPTPVSDPWLGLYDPNGFLAIDNNGQTGAVWVKRPARVR